MFKKKFLILLILILAFGLRVYKYAYFPVAGETEDERAWTMLGSSLIQSGKPTSWSYFAPYKQRNAVIQEEPDPLVQPALDHPPLFSLIPGFAHSLKTNYLARPSYKVIRMPMVIIGTINVFLFYLLLKEKFDLNLTLLASFIYATAPSFVFTSRLVLAENLLISFFLLSSLVLNKQKLKNRLFYLGAISCLAVLTKVSGLIIPISLIIYAFKAKEKKIAKASLIGMVAAIVAFCIYGGIYNWQLFIEVIAAQSSRELGLATLQNRLFLNPNIIEKIFFDGWIMLGFLAMLLIFLLKEKQLLFFKIYFVMCLFFIIATSGEQTFHAWYDYIFYPLLAFSSAWLIKYIFKEKNYLLFAILWILLLPLIRLVLVYAGVYHQIDAILIRIIMSLGLLPYIFDVMIKNKKISNKTALALLLIIFASNIYLVLNIQQEIYWEQDLFFNPKEACQ